MPNIGPTELIILLVIVLVIFGPKRLPGLGKQLGDGMRDFKEAVTSRHDKDDEEDADERPALTQASASDEVPPAVIAEPVHEPAAERTGRDA